MFSGYSTTRPTFQFLATIVSIAGFVWIFQVHGAHAGGFSATKVIDLVNKARENAGLNTLSESPVLTRAAQDKARDMVRNDYFAHTSPSGVSPWHWLEKEGYSPRTAGENLAINFSNAKEQQEAWMASKTHRANILNQKFKETGVAVVEGVIDGEKSTITVQFFGTSLGAVVADKQAEPTLIRIAVREILGAESEMPAKNDIPSEVAPETIPVYLESENDLSRESFAYGAESRTNALGRGAENAFAGELFALTLLLFAAVYFNAAVSMAAVCGPWMRRPLIGNMLKITPFAKGREGPSA